MAFTIVILCAVIARIEKTKLYIGTILLVGLGQSKASQFTELKHGLLFQHMGTSLVNPSICLSYKFLAPCDVIIFADKLLENIQEHSKICDLEIKDGNSDLEIIEDSSKSFVLF